MSLSRCRCAVLKHVRLTSGKLAGAAIRSSVATNDPYDQTACVYANLRDARFMGGDYLRLRYAYAVLFGLLTAEQLISAILASSFGVQRRGAFLADVAVVPVL